MSFLADIFNAPQNAANAQIQAALQGLSGAEQQIGQGNQYLTSNYGAALQPWQQIIAQAQPGVGQLGNVLGLNGAAGNQAALSTLQSTPGYQFQLQQGNNAINAAAAANGTLNSGNQLTALSNYNQGLANSAYNNYVSQLQPYLNYSTVGATGAGNTYTGLGNQLNANSNTLAQLITNAYGNIGNAQANADLGTAQNILGGITSIAGLGSSLGNLASGLGSLAIFSDARVKEDIEPIGELYDGTNVYSFRYKGDYVPRIGLMAQEVEQKYPEAVTEIGGIKAVDYGKATSFASQLAKIFDEAA